jgi:RND family efflux transporter MFP subunit
MGNNKWAIMKTISEEPKTGNVTFKSKTMGDFVRKRRWNLIVGCLMGLIMAGLIVWVILFMVRSDQTKARTARLPLPVQTLPATVTTLHEEIGASGVLQQSLTVSMTVKIVSRVLNVPVDLGYIVKKGDLLTQLDDALFVSNLTEAEVSEEHARNQLRRMEALERQKLGSAVDTETARTLEAQAQGALIAARINLDNTKVISPLNAVVLARGVNPGEFTKVDQEAIRLGAIDDVMMVANVSEVALGSVHVGMKADVGTDAYPGVTFKGEVVKINANISDQTRTFETFILIHNNDLRLKPGVTGYARLEGKRMALAIPSTAIMNPIGDRATVFVVGDDERAHLREIRQGLMVGGMTEILNGVREGEQLVTVGQLNLRENDLVYPNKVAPWNKR